MNADLSFSFYAIGRLALEIGLLSLVAWLASRAITSAHVRRGIWQATLCAMLLIPAMELGDWSAWVRSHFRNTPQRGQFGNDPSRRDIQAVIDVSHADPTGNRPQTDARVLGAGDRSSLSDGYGQWPLWIWLFGFGCFALRMAGCRMCLHFRRRKSGEVGSTTIERVERLRRPMGLGVVALQMWPELRSPIAFGIVRPTIAIPENFEDRFTEIQIEAILTHELAHLAGEDPLWLGIADGVVALFWWHPVVWWARRRMVAESELVADSASALLPEGPGGLAEVLVKLGREMGVSKEYRGISVAGNTTRTESGFRSQLGRRVAALVEIETIWRPMTGKKRAFLIGIAILLGLIIAGVPGPAGYSLGWTTLRASNPQDSSPTTAEVSPSFGATSDIAEFHPIDPAVSRDASTEADTTLQSDLAEPSVKVLVRFVEVLMGSPDDIGIDWVFGQLPEENPPVTAAAFGDYGRIEELRNEDQISLLEERQFSSLLLRFEQKHGIDLLSMPSINLKDGKTGQVAVVSKRTVVGRVEALEKTVDPDSSDKGLKGKNGLQVNYETSEIAVGPVLDVVARSERGGWKMDLTASYSEFLGYDDPSTSVDPAVQARVRELEGKAQLPLPQLRTRRTGGQIWVRPGQTVALRGPSAIQRRVTKEGFWIFRKTKIHEEERRVYVFVTVVP